MGYDAFISYSHAADGRLAPAVQSGLQRLTKPFWKLRALHVFRDETGLAVEPHMWSSIQSALDDSAWFVLLASPEAAASRWVNQEIEHWLTSKPADRILPVVTDGTVQWDNTTSDFTGGSTAIPSALRGVYRDEPRDLDLRWAGSEEDLDVRHPRFKTALAVLAAPIHGVTPEQLETEDVRVHRRTRRVVRSAVTGLVLLTTISVVSTTVALRYALKARAEAPARRCAAMRDAASDGAGMYYSVFKRPPRRFAAMVSAQVLTLPKGAAVVVGSVTGLKKGSYRSYHAGEPLHVPKGSYVAGVDDKVGKLIGLIIAPKPITKVPKGAVVTCDGISAGSWYLSMDSVDGGPAQFRCST